MMLQKLPNDLNVPLSLLELFNESGVPITKSNCIVEIFSGSLESDKFYYPKAVNETMIISFGMPPHCCTVHSEVGISLATCYFGHSCVHKYLSRRPDHIPNLHLQND
jgi:hypothetical protein